VNRISQEDAREMRTIIEREFEMVVGLPARDPSRHELANVKQVYRPRR
jgi:hypothetical protein